MNLHKKKLLLCPIIAGLLPAALNASAVRAEEPAPDVQQLVRDASWNELHSKGPSRFFRYRLSEQDPEGSDVKQVVETRDGTVSRLMEKNGQPLTPAQEHAEIARLNNLLAHPEIQQRRHRSEHENDTREDELVRMLPDAFLYTSEGMVEGPSGACYRISFKPKPSFIPPDREGEVFHGMVGELWIDQAQVRLARIDAHLVSDVNFGWGVLGKLFRGGSILEENADVGMDHWESTELRLRLQGRILMVKSVDYSTTQTSTEFRPVPSEISYQDAIRLLLQEQPKGE